MKDLFCPPELKLPAASCAFAILLCGCSSSYTVSSVGKPDAEYSFREVNEELNGRHVEIEMKDGGEISAEEVTISDDSVSWVDASTGQKSRTLTRSINRIVFKNHIVGGIEGFGIVAPAVFTVSWGLGGFSSKGIGGSDGWALPAAAGLVGGGIAMIWGAIAGHSYEYVFRSNEGSDSLNNAK